MKTVKMIGMVAIMSSLMLLVFAVRPAAGAWTDEGLYMKTTDQGVVVDSTSKAYLNLDRGTKTQDCWLGFKSAGAYNWLIATGRTGANSDLSFCSYAYNAWSTPLYLEYATGNVGIGTTTPEVPLQVLGGSTASLADGGHLIIGRTTGANIVMDKNEIMARNNGSTATLYLNKNGGDVVIGNGNGSVGIGTTGTIVPIYGLNVWANDATDPLVLIENTHTGPNADGLSIWIGAPTPGTGNDFIKFYGNLGNPMNGLVGEIQGNGSGGVTYRSVGSDFAEFLPRFQADELIGAGDIVGVFGGKITKVTRQAEQVQVVSTAPIVLGNDPGKERECLYEKVAFLGRAPVKVRGQVRAGDYIVPSGLHDGTGRAVSPKELTTDRHGQIVGRAWESSDKKEVKLIDTAVSLHTSSQALFELSLEKDRQIEQLAARVDALERMMNDLKE